MNALNLPLMFGIGGQELLIILVGILLLFGAKKIPELARGLGRGIREFKDASQEIKREIENAGEDEQETKKLNQQP